MPALNSLAITEMDVVASRFLYAAAILGTRLCDYYFFIKAVRRRLSAINRRIVQETSPANLPPAAVGLGERLRHIIENNRKRIIKPTEKASSAIIADASLHGWGAFFNSDSGDVKIAGGKWERKPFLIMQAEARAVRLALSAFSAILPSTMDVWVDNTSLQGAVNKGSSKSHAMTWELQRIYGFLILAECRQLLPTCGLRKTPQTAYHAVVCLHFRTWRRGGTCEGQRRGLVVGGPQSLPLRK
ncbi:retrotransposon hot spot (RHS) protein [Trypanosoma cruzi Dm28c]|uniref:Retrotransposon hot spot (RHS) protein n=1 Tax=Trypanosoma cruzi Dm28c TaxID=1416333 RepID=V5D2F2_TRYCR|nr:retrotransposon hot spot (RHS) protein [Trypanosoma cruzi Dm28c]